MGPKLPLLIAEGVNVGRGLSKVMLPLLLTYVCV